MFLIGDFIAFVVGVNLTPLIGGSYFLEKMAVSAAILFGANALIVAMILKKGEFRRYGRKHFTSRAGPQDY
jgi:hypothetical protein